MSYEDKTLNCQDCSTAFTFSSEDQQYHAEKGYTNEPKRCPNCRAARRNSGGGGGGYGGGGGGGGYRAPREMHTVICAECGTTTQVPFLPKNDRPVYCSTCYDKVRVTRN